MPSLCSSCTEPFSSFEGACCLLFRANPLVQGREYSLCHLFNLQHPSASESIQASVFSALLLWEADLKEAFFFSAVRIMKVFEPTFVI